MNDRIKPLVQLTGIPGEALRGVRAARLYLFSVLFILAGVSLAADEPFFTFVVIPDSQMMTAKSKGGTPDMFMRQIQWIKTNVGPLNIKFVSHLGDIVDSPSDIAQWNSARAAMDILDGVVPYGITPGNHEGYMYGDRDFTNFNVHFPSSKFSSYPWYGGCYPSNNNKNSYQLFSAGGVDFIIIHIQYNPDGPTRHVWAAGLLKQYASRKAIISTHDYMKGPAITSVGGYIRDNVVNKFDNVFLVVCGHNEYESMVIGTNNSGRPVYQILTDYQFDDPQTAKLRYYKFIPAQNKIEAYTLSTETLVYETNASSRFDIPFDFSVK